MWAWIINHVHYFSVECNYSSMPLFNIDVRMSNNILSFAWISQDPMSHMLIYLYYNLFISDNHSFWRPFFILTIAFIFSHIYFQPFAKLIHLFNCHISNLGIHWAGVWGSIHKCFLRSWNLPKFFLIKLWFSWWICTSHHNSAAIICAKL